MIAATAASCLNPTAPNVARPYVAPRRRSFSRHQPGRRAASRRVAFEVAGGKPAGSPSVSSPYATVGHLAAAAAVAMALGGDTIPQRAVPTASPARFRDLEAGTVRASGLSNVDLEELLHSLTDSGIDTSAFNAPAADATLEDVPALVLDSRDERVVSFADGGVIGSAGPGAPFVELDGLDRQIFSADEPPVFLVELLTDGAGRELYSTLDVA